jgi:hypothetical protein
MSPRGVRRAKTALSSGDAQRMHPGAKWQKKVEFVLDFVLDS